MAISIDSANTGGSGTAGTTFTWNHTVGATANKLVVTVAMNGAYPTGITADSVAMTRRQSADSGGNTSSVWTLDNPTVGTIAIVVTKGNGVPGEGGSVSLIQCAAGIGATGTATGSGTPINNTVTTTGTGNGYVIDAIWTGKASLTVGAGQTQIWHHNSQITTRDAASSYEAYAAGANPSMDWTNSSAGENWAWCAVEIIEGAAASASTRSPGGGVAHSGGGSFMF